MTNPSRRSYSCAYETANEGGRRADGLQIAGVGPLLNHRVVGLEIISRVWSLIDKANDQCLPTLPVAPVRHANAWSVT